MNRCNELCTKEKTGDCGLCDALAERERFELVWFQKAIFLRGFQVLRQWWYFIVRDIITLAFCLGLISLVVGVMGLINGPIPYLSVPGLREFHHDVAAELFGIGIGVLVIDIANGLRATRERMKELILQMGSPDNAFAVEAVRMLRQRGWLTDGSLQDARIGVANLHDVNLDHANLQGVHLIGADLQNANLYAAKLQRAWLTGAKMQRVNLTSAKLCDAQVDGVNLQNTWLSGSDWQRADLTGSDFRRVVCLDVDLSGANLSIANLEKTYFEHIKLEGADLLGANLLGAYWRDVSFNTKTRLPDETYWTPETDMTRFTNPNHPKFWRPDFTPSWPGWRETVIDRNRVGFYS